MEHLDYKQSTAVKLFMFAYTRQSIAPVTETGFSHRLTAYKIVRHFFGLSYQKISGNNQVKNIFFRISNISVPCPHAQLTARTLIEKLWTFFRPWDRDRSQSPPCRIFRVKQIHHPRGTDFKHHNLTSTSVIFWRIKSIPALKEYNMYNGRRPITFKWSGKI